MWGCLGRGNRWGFLVSKAGLGYLIVYGGQVFKLAGNGQCRHFSITAGIMYLGVILLGIILRRNS